MPPIMRKSPFTHRVAGFTLLELLVVIAIIGILAGLMFPATTGALRRAERTHAENTCYNLKNAISAYFTEYRKYPAESDATESQELRTDSDLMDIILGADNDTGTTLNPRKIAFYSGKQAKRAPSGGENTDGPWRKGITLGSDGGGELYDPYSKFYLVRMDLDYNNRVEKPSWDESTESTMLPDAILIWSAGKDTDENEARDNIKTW